MRMRVFDWEKAARLIAEKYCDHAVAGLAGDWDCTVVTILEDGRIVTDPGTYLASNWAIPTLNIDGVDIECFVEYDSEDGFKWDASTSWPDEALAILNREVGGIKGGR